ncbi:MAG: hypothetical protein PHO37_19230 [Kiritimatiellae bacterium]|nr:hypothetical protein [Kiritimatiellia bacterium]
MKRMIMLFIVAVSLNIFADKVSSMAYRASGTKCSELTRASLNKEYEEKILKLLRKDKKVDTLIRLNDQETINKVIDDYKSVEGKDTWLRREIESSCAPWILGNLAPLLYKEEVPAPRSWNDSSGVSYDYGYSMSVAEIMTTIVGQSPEFSDEVRRSAQEANPHPYHCLHPERVTWMRKWWEINKKAILAERFADITPITQDLIPPGTRERLGKLYRAALAAATTGQVASAQNITNDFTNTTPSLLRNCSNEKPGRASEEASPLLKEAMRTEVTPKSAVAPKKSIFPVAVVSTSVIVVLLGGYAYVVKKRQ